MESLFLATVLGLLLWITILLLPSRPYSTRESLEAQPIEQTDLSEVTVLIPARNEATIIIESLLALQKQDPSLKIILVDDQSTDNTVELAYSIRMNNLTVLPGAQLQPGWSGKLWALEQGRRFINTSHILLLDADIILEPGLIETMLSRAKKNNIKLLSLMAHLRMVSFWEKLLIPAFIFFFKLLYPFYLSNLPDKKIAAAAGGCVLLQTDVLEELGGFECIKNELIDDCALAKKFKQNGYKTWVGLTHSAISIRSYDSPTGIWKMIARTAYTQLHHSLLLLSICVILMIIAFLIPLIAVLQTQLIIVMVGITTLCIQFKCYYPILRYYSMNSMYVFSLPFVGMIYLFFTLSSAYFYYFNKGAAWKERYYK